MKEIKLKVDWYTKTVLTIIALALCWFSVKPLFTAKEVIASGEKEVVDVNIVRLGGYAFFGHTASNPDDISLPVRIKK